MIGKSLFFVALLHSAPSPYLPSHSVAVEKNGTNYNVYTPVVGTHGKYARWQITDVGAPGLGVMREVEIRACLPYSGHNASTTGAWSTLNIKGAHEDRVLWSKVAGATAEITFTIAPGEVLGLMNFKNTNGGIGHFTIDGQSSLANRLPEDGSGNRWVDFYSSSGPTPNLYRNTRQVTPIADNLMPGTHTIKLTCAGDKDSRSSDIRVFLDAFVTYRDVATEEDRIGGDFFIVNSIPLTARGAWESVVLIGDTYYGTNQHGNERSVVLNLAVDGIPRKPTAYEMLMGDSVIFTSGSIWEKGDVMLAQNARYYTFHGDGLDLGLTTVWMSPQPLKVAYQAMFPVLDGPGMSGFATFSGGTHGEPPTNVLNLGQNTGLLRGRYDARQAWLFNDTHPRTFSLEMTDLDQHLNRVRFSVWDLAQPSYNKLYFERQSPPYTPAIGERWQGTAKYRYYYDTARFYRP